MNAPVTANRTRRGSIILIILITIVLASVALTNFIEKASTDLLVEARTADAARLRLDANSALETVLAVLVDFRTVNSGLRSPAEGWGDPLGFAGYVPREGVKVDVAFEDESGKISLPAMTAPQFVELFKNWQLSQGDAEKLTDALMGWMNKDYVPTSAGAPQAADYERTDIPFLPPGRALRTFDELRSINVVRDMLFDEKGNPNDLYQRFVAAFSLYQYKNPNVNGANGAVITSLGVTDSNAIKRVQDYLTGKGQYEHQGPGYFKNSADLATLLGTQTGAVPQIGTEISALRIIVTVREGRLAYRLNVVVASPGGASVPATTPPDQATPTPANASSTDSATSNTASSSSSGASADSTATTSKLNYPFTVLEIRENDEIPSTPAIAGS